MLGGFFVYASLDKIWDPAAFAKIVYQWQVVGPVAVEPRRGDPALDRARSPASSWSRGSGSASRRSSSPCCSSCFIVAAASVMARGIDIENCGCVSVAKAAAPSAWPPAWTKGVGWFLVTRNLVLLGAALALAFVTPARPSPAVPAS